MTKLKNKYSFKKYSKKFPKLYQLERERIRKILPRALIAHIGSTAVPCLCGKGIIDVGIAMPKKYRINARNKLEKAGYTYKESSGDAERFFLRRDYKYRRKIRRVHLHLTWLNSLNWKKTIAFVWYLRRNSADAEEYALIKKKASRFAKDSGEKYRAYKTNYIKKLTKKALWVYLKHKALVQTPSPRNPH
ncbi:MAG TPA: GrpB family protein [Nanoarchaeota archaeon]|nr:GrpB family protein [Nanoarchaeota archaeon]